MKTYLIMMLFGSLLSQNALAEIIDLTSFSLGTNFSQTFVTPNATFNSRNGFYILNNAANVRSICGNNGSTCAGDFDIVFKSTFNNFKFNVSGFDIGADLVKIKRLQLIERFNRFPIY